MLFLTVLFVVLLVAVLFVVFVVVFLLVFEFVFSVVFEDSSSPVLYNSFISSAVYFLSGIKNHNGYVGGPYEPPGITALCILFISIFTAYGT